MKHEWDYSSAAQGGKTSVKIHNAPGKYLKLTLKGGNSQFSIGWGTDSNTNQQTCQSKVDTY